MIGCIATAHRTTHFVQIATLLVLAISVGCSESTPTGKTSSTRAIRPATPFWTQESLESTKVALNAWLDKHAGKLVSRRIEISSSGIELFPYYDGSDGFTYTTYSIDSPLFGGFSSRRKTDIKHEFGAWTTTFIYLEEWSVATGIPDGAITVDSSGQLLAEAKKLRHEKDKLVIKERHYGENGELTYTATSTFNYALNAKRGETDHSGIKQQECYFLFPFD